jgi:general secretion pathway protein D
MRFFPQARLAAAVCALAGTLLAQAPPRIYQLPPPAEAPKPEAAKPQAPAGQNVPAGPGAPAAPATQPAAPAAEPRLADQRGFLLGGVSLSEMIEILAKMMKINYILDPRVKGSVTVYTYGEVKPVDLMPFMQTILRVNGAAMVKVGDLYRIVPLNTVSNLPLSPVVNADPKTLPDDERMILNLVFLKYATATELDKLIAPFLGEGAGHTPYEPANLLIIQDNSRNMRRTMELISLFDADSFAGKRVRLFDVENSRPADLVKDLETVFRAYALSEKSSAVKFIPVDRINTVIAVAPNPGIFVEVENWIRKLDVPVKITAGAVNNYVYRLKYGRSETIAMAIMALYTGNTMALAMMASMNQMGMGMGGYGMGGYGMGGYGMGGYGMGGYGMGGYGMGGYGMGGYGMGGYGGMGYGGMGGYAYYPGTQMPQATYSSVAGGGATAPITPAIGPNASPQVAGGPSTDLTGAYLGMSAPGGTNQRIPHVIPNPFDNTLLVQGTPQEWEQIQSLLRQLDVPPRQVLIDAKIYEVDLTGDLAAGVTAYLEKQGLKDRTLNIVTGSGGLALSTGALVLRAHELIATLSAFESKTHMRVISAPSIIATDSVPAVMNVGQDVPVLTSQAVSSGVQAGGSTPFASTISTRSTGVTLGITARVNSSGVVTLMIDQDVSTPGQNTTSNIDSPSFSRRSFQTQVTVQDGDTIAVGGFIGEQNSEVSGGVPVLHRIPLLGAVFGTKNYSKTRSELIIFLTPRVIYDTNQIQDATDEIRSNLKRIQRMYREQ